MARFARTGVPVNEPQTPSDPRAALDLGRLLGQRRAFGAVAGRCSAAHAQLLRRMRDEKLYLPLAASWRDFCGVHLAISRRHADRLIGFLNRFGPIYFELSHLIGISPQQYLAIEPAVREDSLVVNGEAVSLIPENAPQLLRDRVRDLTSRGRAIANQFVALYNSAHSARDREFILEAATELRMMLMQPGGDGASAAGETGLSGSPSPTSSSPSTIPPTPRATANSSSKPPPNSA